MSTPTKRAITLEQILGDPTLHDRTSLAQRLRAVDPDLYAHASLVAEYVVAMTAFLPALSSKQHSFVVDAAWLHDIGKLTIAPEILHKPGPLTVQEWVDMRSHPVRAANYLDISTHLAPAAPYVRQHHEWHNGRGYPSGLAGTQISLGARLIEVADAYDAMTSWRPYRATLSDDDALAELRTCAGSQFDPDIVDLFVAATSGIRTKVAS